MGPLDQVLGMIPGFGGMKELQEKKGEIDESQLGRIEAIISSMTPRERRNHAVINGSRRKRIARGSGTTVEEVNRLLRQFVEMKKMLKMMGNIGKGKKGRRRLMGMLGKAR
jgi:signal recognition particle subunit SRP54